MCASRRMIEIAQTTRGPHIPRPQPPSSSHHTARISNTPPSPSTTALSPSVAMSASTCSASATRDALRRMHEFDSWRFQNCPRPSCHPGWWEDSCGRASQVLQKLIPPPHLPSPLVSHLYSIQHTLTTHLPHSSLLSCPLHLSPIHSPSHTTHPTLATMDLSSLDTTLPPALADAERDMGDKFRGKPTPPNLPPTHTRRCHVHNAAVQELPRIYKGTWQISLVA
jgi:hypothetical protein